MKCPKCNLEVPEKAKFCNHCSEEIKGKVCPNPECGRAGLPIDANFCPECRSQLKFLDEGLIIHKNDDGITSYSSYTSGNSGLVGEHLLLSKSSIQHNPQNNNPELTKAWDILKYEQNKLKEWNEFSYGKKFWYAFDDFKMGLFWIFYFLEKIDKHWNHYPLDLEEYLNNIIVILVYIIITPILFLLFALPLIFTAPIHVFYAVKIINSNHYKELKYNVDNAKMELEEIQKKVSNNKYR